MQLKRHQFLLVMKYMSLYSLMIYSPSSMSQKLSIYPYPTNSLNGTINKSSRLGIVMGIRLCPSFLRNYTVYLTPLLEEVVVYINLNESKYPMLYFLFDYAVYLYFLWSKGLSLVQGSNLSPQLYSLVATFINKANPSTEFPRGPLTTAIVSIPEKPVLITQTHPCWASCEGKALTQTLHQMMQVSQYFPTYRFPPPKETLWLLQMLPLLLNCLLLIYSCSMDSTYVPIRNQNYHNTKQVEGIAPEFLRQVIIPQSYSSMRLALTLSPTVDLNPFIGIFYFIDIGTPKRGGRNLVVSHSSLIVQLVLPYFILISSHSCAFFKAYSKLSSVMMQFYLPILIALSPQIASRVYDVIFLRFSIFTSSGTSLRVIWSMSSLFSFDLLIIYQNTDVNLLSLISLCSIVSFLIAQKFGLLPI